MRLLSVPIGNAFRYDLGTAVKVKDGEDCDIIPCLTYGLMQMKRLVHPVAKVEKFWLLNQDDVEDFTDIRSIEWGMVVTLPYKSIRYLITSGISIKGIVVAKLGGLVRVERTSDVDDLGYAGDYLGIPVIE